jgi:hypothetical protein
VGDGGVCQDTLDIILKKGQQVTDEHGSYGYGGKREKEGAAGLNVTRRKKPKQNRDHSTFGDGGHKGGNRGRRALVNIGRP